MPHPTNILCRGPGAKPQAWRVLSGLMTALLVACTGKTLGDTDAGVTSTGEATTTSTSTSMGSTGPATLTTGGLTGTDGATSEPLPGTSTGPGETGGTCTEFGQDTGCPEVKDCPGTHQLDPECPEGHKCTIDGGTNMTHCVEIVPEAKGLYEPCTATGDLLSGIDDCGLGMLCWSVNERGQGICLGMCDGEDDSDCVCADPAAKPSWCQECLVGVCVPPCDPLLPDCVNDEICVPHNDTFVCVTDASEEEGQVNDPCEFVNFCDEGLVCVPPAMASSACPQDAGGCCTPFCKFPGGACPNPDQACVAWFEPGMAPEGLEDVGSCMIP